MRARAEDGEDRVPAVELADGQQIQTRHEQADPRGEIETGSARCRASVRAERGAEQAEQRRVVEDRSRAAGRATSRELRRGAASDVTTPAKAMGMSDDETGERPRDADVEERAARRDGRLDLDERAERAGEKERRRGDKERQRRVHAVAAAGDVMPGLVREQDGEQRARERRALRRAASDASKAYADERADSQQVIDGDVRAGNRASSRARQRRLMCASAESRITPARSPSAPSAGRARRAAPTRAPSDAPTLRTDGPAGRVT